MKVGIKLRKHDPIWDSYIDKLKIYADVELFYDTSLGERYDDIEVMITTNLNESMLSKFPNLKEIILFKTGMDGLPLEMLAERKVHVQCSHANASIIAEHAVALSLALLHRIPEFHRDLKNGIWYSDGNDYMWKSISDMKVGILGYGNIGAEIGNKLAGFHCEVWGYNRRGQYREGIIGANSIAELIENCDLIYICLPKSEETQGLIDTVQLQKMKGKYIINIGRAEVCEEEALYNALRSGELGGYASDVWYVSSDKMDKNKRVYPSKYTFEELDNVIMSPHCATHKEGAHERYIRDAVELCIKYIKDN